jgi:hypothetical protein
LVAGGREKAVARTRAAGAMKFTSRILVGLMACRGLVEPREGIGLWMFYAEKN